MSALAQGNYYFVNNVTSSSGNQFACNFNGANSAVSVVEFQWGSPSQVWVITSLSGHENTYFVLPSTNYDLLIAMGDGGLETIDSSNQFTWNIEVNDYVYTVSDGTQTQFWDIESPTEGAQVILAAKSNDGTQSWQLVPASN